MITRDIELKSAALKERFGDAVTINAINGEVLDVLAAPGQVKGVLSFVKNDPRLDFHMLHDLTAVDYPSDGQIGVIYRLFRVGENPEQLVVRVRLDRQEPKAPTVTDLWGNAGFLEREAYEMFGIHFDGHPDLTRLLLWDGFPGHPLRKDFKMQEEGKGGEAR